MLPDAGTDDQDPPDMCFRRDLSILLLFQGDLRVCTELSG